MVPMRSYSLSHLSDVDLVRDLTVLVERDRANTAALLAHLAEVDERKLYLPAAYPSLFEYCVGALGMSEDAALKRIQAARVARRFPEIFRAIADGRLHLSGVNVLARHLSASNASTLLAAAAHKTKSEIERLVADWFPLLDVPATVAAFVPVQTIAGGSAAPKPIQAPTNTTRHAPGHVRTEPLGGGRVAVTVMLDDTKLQYAKELLSHQLPSGDLARVLDLALDALIAKLEKRKFAATRKPRPERPPRAAKGANPRHIPAAVKREVWKRDGGRCTFTSRAGHRCTSRSRLEYDHVLEVARGGESTADNIRLRCRAHNQFTAEQTFGAEHMRRKREEGRPPRIVRGLDVEPKRQRPDEGRPAVEVVSGPHAATRGAPRAAFSPASSRSPSSSCRS